MRTLLLGLLLMLSSALIALLVVARLPGFEHAPIANARTVAHFTGTVVLVPMLASWLCAEAFRLIRRPRLLEPGVGGFVNRLLAGAVIGLLTLPLAAALLVLYENHVSDWLLTAGAAALATVAVLMFARRVKTGRCIACEYDLAGVTTATQGLCPECGHVLFKAV